MVVMQLSLKSQQVNLISRITLIMWKILIDVYCFSSSLILRSRGSSVCENFPNRLCLSSVSRFCFLSSPLSPVMSKQRACDQHPLALGQPTPTDLGVRGKDASEDEQEWLKRYSSTAGQQAPWNFFTNPTFRFS